MATVHTLFLGVLFMALCHDMDTFHRPLTQQGSQTQLTDEETRSKIVSFAQQEIGIRESTGRNDGKRVEEYLRYTGLGKGYAWCAAFVSFCFGKVGLNEPRNPWSPALFPSRRTYCKGGDCRHPSIATVIRPADVFGIYGQQDRRINHVGLVKERQGNYLLTIEGNSNNRVESKRRHLTTIYALANWVPEN